MRGVVYFAILAALGGCAGGADRLYKTHYEPRVNAAKAAINRASSAQVAAHSCAVGFAEQQYKKMNFEKIGAVVTGECSPQLDAFELASIESERLKFEAIYDRPADLSIIQQRVSVLRTQLRERIRDAAVARAVKLQEGGS